MSVPLRPLFAATLLGIAALSFAACDEADPPAARVFEAAPWTGAEEYVYLVTDRGVKGEGECRLLTTPEVEPGKTKFERRCAKDVYRDDASVLVDAKTIEPIASTRTYADGKKNQTVTHTVTYGDGKAEFRTDDGEKKREATRDLPQPVAGTPDPGWYDDDELLWLARGIRLASGYDSAYVHVINAGQPRVLTVRISVEGPETVDTPAGKFEAWKVRFDREQSVYFVWVETSGSRKVVKARIEDTIYTLIDVR